MPIPRAVQEQAERAEAAHLALLNTGTPPAQEPPPADPPADPPVTPDPPPAPPQPEPEPDSWELKYRVLRGKYDSEVPRLAADVRSLQAQLDALKSSSPTPAADDVAQMTPEAVVDRYGEDFAAAVASIVEARTGRKIAEVSSKVDGIAQNTAKTSRSAFMSELTSLVPTWREIDAEDGFTAYLDDFDVQTGRKRREFFNEADQSNDAARIASFFIGYSRGKRSQPRPPAAPQAPKEAPPSVDHLIAPDSSQSSSAPPGKKIWSRAEVNTFYKEARPYPGSKTFGRYTRDEFDAINLQIDTAIAEGRLR